MSKLLHSKTFRKNLYKWLFMYICALLVISTVVTYSRYITKNSLGDEARAAKFDIKIEEEKICLAEEEYKDMTEEQRCNNIKNKEKYNTKPYDIYIKPYDTLEYYFNTDSSELEVLSENIIYINYDDINYGIKTYYRNSNNDVWSEITTPNNIITTEEGANKKGITYYKIILTPNQDKISNSNNTDSQNIIRISYKYTQKTS